MYPGLQSALLAEASTAILLAGAVLLYVTFREKYLVPWIAGWTLYTLSKIFITLSFGPSEPHLWATLGNTCFALAAGLFSAAILYYVYHTRLLLTIYIGTFLAVLLGVAQALWANYASLLLVVFGITWRVLVGLAIIQLVRFAWGRRNYGLWLLALVLPALHMDPGPGHHALPAYDIIIDLLLGISMMMTVLEDLRVQVQRLDVLNRISSATSSLDEFSAMIDLVVDELMRSTKAKAAWFRVLKAGKLELATHRGLSETFLMNAAQIDDFESARGKMLHANGLGIRPVKDVPQQIRKGMQGLQHIVIVPVQGKNSRIGVLVLGMPHYRKYTENDRNFLRAAAGQLGLAAENRRLVKQLLRTQNEWESSFNSVPDYVLVHDPQYRILRANQALLDKLQLTLDQVMLKSCKEVLPHSGIEWQHCPYCEAGSLRTDRDPCFGGYSFVSTSAYAGAGSDGGTVHVVKDITQARAAEDRYRALFDHMQEGVFVSSPDGQILDCNEAFVRMLGFAGKEELLQIQAPAALYADIEDRRKFLEEMDRNGFVRNFEYVLRCKDGRLINVVESSFATLTTSGTVERYQGVVLDVTEKKRAEDEIRRRNRELYALNNIAVTCNQSFDLDEILQLALLQIVELFSTDTAALYLFDEETSMLRKKAAFGHRSSWFNENQGFILPARVVEDIKEQRLEIINQSDAALMPDVGAELIQREGLTSWLWMILWRKEKILGLLGTSSRTVRRFGTSDENVLVAVGRQLATTIDKVQLYDETRKAYENLRRTQEQLLQSEKMSAVGRLISGVAHELNNPLTAIIGYSQLLENEQNQERIREFTGKMHKQAQRAQKIIQNLLSFARQHKPERIYVDLRRVMEDTIALRDYELKANDVVVERDFEEAMPSVIADPHQLEQVFLNIINNAVDAILETGSRGKLKIKIFSENGWVLAEFQDSGPGMADPKHAFDPFYTTKAVGKGTGLGLSICYGIVQEHGGEIFAHNSAEGGALVRVRLPKAIGEKPVSEGERIAARREARLDGRVLLVDEAQVIDFEREVLTAAGLEVIALTSSDEAIEYLNRENFDVVLLDSKVPGAKSAEEIYQWINETRPELASRTVLVLPNASDPAMRIFVDKAKILCFVKPFEAADLLAVVRRVLRQKNAAVSTQHSASSQ